MIKKIKNYLFTPRFHFNRFQFNLVALFFITVGLVAGSYLTLKKIINLFALEPDSKTWSIDVGTSNTFTFNTDLVTVGGSGVQPISNVNKITNSSFNTDTSSWNLAAVASSTNTPAGWVVVPGSSTFGTSDFLVMKYEAKCANTATPGVGLIEPAFSTQKTYRDDGATNTVNNCTSANDRVVTSLASGYPITYLLNSEANTRCGSIAMGVGSSAHLINNNEWMTITRDAEAQNSNWSLGVGGSGYLYAGHNDGGPNWALQASTNDANRAAFTDIGGTTEAQTTATNNNSSQSGSVGNQVRTFNLSNGQVIWDMAGNVSEWTNNIQTTTVVNTTNGWLDWNHADVATGARALYASNSYLSAQGMGRVSRGAIGNGFLRGGNWYNSSNAGAFSLFLSYSPSTRNASIGFRCASDPVAISQSFSSNSGRGAVGANLVTVGPLTDVKLTQSINVGNTNTYDFLVYVYDNGSSGGTVNGDVASLFYNGSAIGTTYIDAGSGWWKLSGTLIGADDDRDFGVLIKSGKTVSVDDFSLTKQGKYSIYTTTGYLERQIDSWNSFGTTEVTNGDAEINYQICNKDGDVCETENSWQYYKEGIGWTNATNSITDVNSAEVVNEKISSFDATTKKISVKAIMSGVYDMPSVSSFTVGFQKDIVPPGNIEAISMKKNAGAGSTMVANSWTNDSGPYFSWDEASDDAGGSGIKGYCLYLSQDDDPNLETADGNLLKSGNASLDDIRISSENTECGGGNGFLVSSTNIDLGTTSYRSNNWLTTSLTPYYLHIKAVDKGGNLTNEDNVSFNFRFDDTRPKNVNYISCASGNFSNVNDMSFFWPTNVGDSSASSDFNNSGVLGWQYQVDSTDGEWKGSTTAPELNNLKYIPVGSSTYNLTTDDVGTTDIGSHVIYFRTVDKLGNVSSDSTIRTCSSSYGGAAPNFNPVDKVTINPTISTTNSFALSWPEANAAEGKNVTHYYYMINNNPPSSLATLQSNPAIYIDMGTSRSIEATALVGVNKGDNNVYVVAVDNVGNYSSSNYISGAFTLNSTEPDNVSLSAPTDSSIKNSSQWNVTLTWTAPTYQGAGNLSYLIYRSTDGINFTQTGTSNGLSYVDNAPASAEYFYRVVTRDGAGSLSSGVNAPKSITPTGKWDSAPSLDSGPEVGNITTKKATITWGTNRSSDSKVAYGTESGKYGSDEVGNSTQTGSHIVNLTNLKAGTKYYYKAKWTDEDGNGPDKGGISEEKTFTTAAAPTVKDVAAKNVGLSSAIIQFTSKDASKVKIYYGTSTSFGGLKEVSTATNETTYTSELSGLLDGTKYYYKINTLDSDGSEYEGTTLDFSTLPRPKISGVRLEQVANTAQTTVRVSWTTNTEVSSIVTYYPENDRGAIKDDVRVVLEKGVHTMVVRGLLPETNYILTVKGRDKLGNEAVSDAQRFTTATDTRPPQIMNLKLITGTIPPVGFVAGEITSQIIVSWDTDEPATSQVEFGQGAGTSYSQKTQEDGNLTNNHTVIISNLTPSQVYHLRVISKDKAGNETKGIDNVIIASKATKSALDLVVKNLSEAFSFFSLISK